MMSSIITQLSPCGVRSHSELGVLNVNLRQCRAQELPPPRVSVRGAPPLGTSGSCIERRDLMKMMVMVSGAAVLNLAKTSDAHAAAARHGEVETPEQIASSPFIQRMYLNSPSYSRIVGFHEEVSPIMCICVKMLPYVHPYGYGITMVDHFPPMRLTEVEHRLKIGERTGGASVAPYFGWIFIVVGFDMTYKLKTNLMKWGPILRQYSSIILGICRGSCNSLTSAHQSCELEFKLCVATP